MAVTESPDWLFAVLHAASVLESSVEAKLSDVGLSLPKLAALYRLTQAGESLPLGQLADRLACVKSNVTQLVDRLEADGLVSRTADPNDRRSRLALLTEAGKKAYQRKRDSDCRPSANIWGADPDDTEKLHELLAKLDK